MKMAENTGLQSTVVNRADHPTTKKKGVKQEKR